MDKILILKKYMGEGVEDALFPNSDNPIEIGAFRYDAKRMGGAPTITASVSYPTCLDNVWTDAVYALFNGEKYFLKQTPTSSYNNDDVRYKHEVELVSERVILNNVYFYDAVAQGEVPSDDKPVSNGTKFVFWGDIVQFKDRLNASLRYSGIDYVAVVDEGVTSEEKLVSFEDAFFSNAIQEAYNTFEVPFYFSFNEETGQKEIHFGYTDNVIAKEFEYGIDNSLISITKSNANYKTVNRVTATGSSDNIPFYYPNNSPKGDIAVETNREELQVNIRDYEKFSNKVGIDDTLQYEGIPLVTIESVVHKNGGVVSSGMSQNVSCGYLGFTDEYKMVISSRGNTEVILSVDSFANFSEYDGFASSTATFQSNIRLFANGKQVYGNNGEYTIDAKEGENLVSVYIDYKFNYGSHKSTFTGDAGINYAIENIDTNYWYLDGKQVRLADLGIEIAEGCEAQHGDTITQRLVKYVKTSRNLMPSIYRETDGDERFYNAINGAYADENGEAIEFANPYVEGKPKEHIFTVEDIKPSIEGMVYNGQRIDMFEAFAYDVDDNDETYEDESGNVFFKHPYFFAKLKPLGFNLFKHAIEQQPMTISFTSGNCGACNFEIAVDEDTQKNTVQVDEDGNLVYDENGMVLCGVEGSGQGIVDFQDIQQDTTDHSVWIALRKEEDTYGILMPKAPVDGAGGHRPTEEDTFVILGINLPKSYILNAEKKLEEEIIKYMRENNEEKFKFSISFSRIFFEESEENKEILNHLNENARLVVRYNGKSYTLYVNSFSYQMSEGEILPQISVELDDELTISQNALQQAINAVRSDVGKALGSLDFLGLASPYFLRKDADDEARGKINFSKGIKFGEGGKVEVLDNNSAKLTIEYLEVTKKASFTSLEIQEKTHVGGQILITPAAINCGEVEEFEDYYRCYFQTKGTDGDEIFNQFAVNDQAICQTFNSWGSKYYWRLVVGVGEDYIDLSKAYCDEDSGVPSAGDKIIQLGNQKDETRQDAIVLAAYGEGSPYIIQYKGINKFELTDDKIVTKLSSTENIFKGKVHMELGSDGLDTLPEWIEVKEKAEEALEKAGSIGEGALAELEEYIDGVRQELQDQIDGAVDSYFEDYEPTTTNAPANAWQTEAKKESHLNDTFTNLTDGRSWRWGKVAGSYAWIEIADTATSEALKLAGQAKASVDGKIRMFVTEPYTPYSVGDLWSRGEDAPLMICVKDKETGTFDEADWSVADDAHAYVDETIENIKVGGQNLLRNSGFTGDYLSEQLADETVLEAAAQLYSSPLDHWTATSVTVRDSDLSTSGKQVYSASGRLYQSLAYKVFANEEYILSFSAKGTSARFTIGATIKEVTFTDEYARYEIPIIPLATNNSFIVQFGGFIYDLKLEKGNKATAWSPSPLDNASDRAYYQSLKYLSEAMEKGSTDVFGGLILTNTILLGNPSSNPLESNTAGVNGITTDSTDDVAFWAGGTFDQANDTVMAYTENPRYQPTAEELANLAKAVITHGGRAILNDAILRGTIYAKNGEFNGKINVDAPSVDGRVLIDDNGLAYFGKHNDEEYMRVALGGTCQGASLATYAPNAQTSFCTNTTMLAIGDEDTDALHAKGNVWLYDGVVYVDKLSFLSTLSGDHGKIEGKVDFDGEVAFNGKVKGLQETIVISDSNMHRINSENGASILVNMTSGTAKIALGSTNDGNEVIIESKGASIQLSASDSIYDHYNQSYLSSAINNRGVIRLKYYKAASEWTMTWLYRY